ncbi:hypothetical protein K458DRAFT_417198 [Lentithecium fluviatile CBS 122367]|uniref:Uncharacterized protein n=1 Tax=Lentithecium fluviatile CBS 122367 TaxID=1168545 RepID=A0A6G1J3M0_9PLEO|nr:hypothetical protein K458DRAFT_417198 [Lentithecium fluviatile CBS 122367]
MGGQAFINVKSDTPIKVPRMLPDVYHKFAGEIATKLETLFDHVTIPREAPGKLDYGDIDFLVEGIRSPNDRDIWNTIKDLLGASLHVPRGGSHSFGIPHPDTSDAFVQVDVELSPGNGTPDSAELFEWTRFMKGDSDLLQIIGVCHRPLGLTCNDRGLHVRVEEIEPYNKKMALIFLTRDPNRAMEFYGLDTSEYRAGFQDENNLFNWVSEGRFFAREIFDGRVEKSNDRSRQNKRAMYRRFVEEYMPAHPEAAKGKGKVWTRQEVLDEALNIFSKHAQYEAMLAEHHAKEDEEALWKQIRDLLPLEGNSLGGALKGLKHWVGFIDGQPYITAQALESTPVWTAAVSPACRPSVMEWVVQNWQEVKALEKKRAKYAKEAATSNASAW